jgi:hypothetical protein
MYMQKPPLRVPRGYFGETVRHSGEMKMPGFEIIVIMLTLRVYPGCNVQLEKNKLGKRDPGYPKSWGIYM